MKAKIINLGCALVVGVLAIGASLGYAQEEVSSQAEVSKAVLAGANREQMIGARREVLFESLSDKEKAKLLALKKTDPDKFREVVREKLKERWEYLKKLRQDNPEKFRKVMESARQRIRKRLEELRKKDPEKFKQIMAKHRERMRRRLEELRKKDPEKFRKVIARRRQMVRKRLEKICEEDPDRCAAIKGKIKKRWDVFRTEHPEEYKRIEQRWRGKKGAGRGIGTGLGLGKE